MSSSRVRAKKQVKKRAQRATSNVFAMFDQSQIQEFKEAFNMIDQNRDGFIDKEDLQDMLASLGNYYQQLIISFYCVEIRPKCGGIPFCCHVFCHVAVMLSHYSI